MRKDSCAATIILLACVACDKQDEAGKTAPSASPAATAATTAAPSAAAAAAPPAPSASASAGAAAPSAVPMPERPIPRPQTTVGSGMPIEVQQKAIGYMVAMRAPRPDEAPADAAFAAELAEKLRPIILSMDTGADKARLNRVEVEASGRQLNLLMAGGCDAKTPLRAVVQRAGVSFATLVARGVLVVRCNDARYQCLQSTRDPEDVLCTTAPRHR